MGYRSLLVHLDPGRSNANLLAFSGELADRFDARVIGLTACAPPIMSYADVGVDGEAFEIERSEIVDQIRSAETEFRVAFRDRGTTIEWRASEGESDLARYVSRQARNADLVVTGVEQGDMFDATRAMHTGALVMQVGRPVLLVPLDARTASLDRVLVGWKDTRETRRAVADALPLMRRATVVVVQVASEGHMDGARRHLDDVLAWLMQHGVAAQAFPVASTGNDAADLLATAERERCNIIVAGAYGHSRVREWVLGGVTKDLLMNPHRCSLVSH